MEDMVSHDKILVEELRPKLEEEQHNRNGKISKPGLKRVLKRKEVQDKLHKLKLDRNVILALFRLLDAEGRGKVLIDEVLYGMLHIKGSPADLHLAMVLFQSKRTLGRVDNLYKILEEATNVDPEDFEQNKQPASRPRSRLTTGPLNMGREIST
mmetsp:Transcript_5549/g.10428  ORF Transcript_5549/g.10428 Transcript_5549/m.10428 type:complete len:154 (+) Transcript_5549:1-462(+)